MSRRESKVSWGGGGRYFSQYSKEKRLLTSRKMHEVRNDFISMAHRLGLLYQSEPWQETAYSEWMICG